MLYMNPNIKFIVYGGGCLKNYKMIYYIIYVTRSFNSYDYVNFSLNLRKELILGLALLSKLLIGQTCV